MTTLQRHQTTETVSVSYDIQHLEVSEHYCLYEVAIIYGANVDIISSKERLWKHKVGIASKEEFAAFLDHKTLWQLPHYNYHLLEGDPSVEGSLEKAQQLFDNKSWWERYQRQDNTLPFKLQDFVFPDGALNREALERLRIGVEGSSHTYNYKLEFMPAQIMFNGDYGMFSDESYSLLTLYQILNENPKVSAIKFQDRNYPYTLSVAEYEKHLNEEEKKAKEQYTNAQERESDSYALRFNYSLNAQEWQTIDKIQKQLNQSEEFAHWNYTPQQIIMALGWFGDLSSARISFNSNPVMDKIIHKINELGAVFMEQIQLSETIEASDPLTISSRSTRKI